jgi:hypothetical protein
LHTSRTSRHCTSFNTSCASQAIVCLLNGLCKTCPYNHIEERCQLCDHMTELLFKTTRQA